MPQLLDAHLHFWDPAVRHHAWLADHPALQRRFVPDDLETGRHDLVGAVFVQADCHDDEALDEVQWVLELAAAHPLVGGVVAHAQVNRGRRVERHLAALSAEPLVVGVRWLLQGHPMQAIVDQSLICGVRLLPEWGLTFDLCATHDQLPAVAALVRACPETTFVLDHLGKPPIARGELDPWREDINRLAAFPNVACKLSGLATEAAHGWSAQAVRPYLEHGLNAFGPERCMVGSDWPVLTLRTTPERWFDVVLGVIDELAPHDSAAVLGGTARAVYGLPSQSNEVSRGARGLVRR